MSFGIIAAATIGGVVAYSGAKKAAKGQEAAAQTAATAQMDASQLVYKQFQETKQMLTPFTEGAPAAFQQQQALSGSLGAEAQEEAFQQYRESPGVAFMKERGLRGLERTAAAQGNLQSGNLDKARIGYAQGVAEQDFNNYFNRLGTITGTGLSAASALAGVGQQAAAGQANLVSGAGQSIAAGQIGAAQSYQSGLQGAGQAIGYGANAWMQNRQNQPQTQPASLGGTGWGMR